MSKKTHSCLKSNKSFLFLEKSQKYPWLIRFIKNWERNQNLKTGEFDLSVYCAENDLIDALIYEAAYKDK